MVDVERLGCAAERVACHLEEPPRDGFVGIVHVDEEHLALLGGPAKERLSGRDAGGQEHGDARLADARCACDDVEGAGKNEPVDDPSDRWRGWSLAPPFQRRILAGMSRLVRRALLRGTAPLPQFHAVLAGSRCFGAEGSVRRLAGFLERLTAGRGVDPCRDDFLKRPARWRRGAVTRWVNDMMTVQCTELGRLSART